MAYFVLFLFFALYFGAHWLVYCFFVCILDCRSINQKYYLKLILSFLAVSFIAAFFVSHFWDNLLTKIFYIFSGLWIGVLINLVIFIALFFLFYSTSKIIKKDINKRIAGALVIFLALAVSVYGIINVFTVRVNHIEVKIKDLPAAWENKKIVQLTDMHLGRVLGESFLLQVIGKTNQLEPDVIVITGDLFDATDGSMFELSQLFKQFQAKQGVFYVTGNHEVYLGIPEISKAIQDTGVVFLNDEIKVVNDLQFIGVSYPEFNQIKDMESIISGNSLFSLEKPSILLYHSPSSLLSDGSSTHADAYFRPDMDFQSAQKLGIDLQISGHTHRGQLFPFNFITKVIFQGFDYGLHTLGDFNIYTSSGTGVWGPTMRTSGHPEITEIVLKRK